MIAPTRVEIHYYRAPIRNPLRMSFGAIAARTVLLVRLEDKDGAYGWGEVWSNFPPVGAENKARLLESMIVPAVLGKGWDSPAAAWLDLTQRMRRHALQSAEPGPYAACLAGIDVAMWDLVSRRAGVPLWRALGRSDTPGPLFAYASNLNPDGVVDYMAQCRERGYRGFKLKVGFDASRDVANVRAACDDLRPGERFMVDANQGWDIATARPIVQALAEQPLQWIEEPLCVDDPAAHWAELAALSKVPLAGGENILGLAAFETAIQSGHLGVVQPDVGKWGGFSGCLPVAQRALRRGRRYCPHWLNSGIGLLASAHLLAAVGGDGMLEHDAMENPLQAPMGHPLPPLIDGRFTLPEASGLGVEPDRSAARSMLVSHREFSAAS